MLYHGYKNSEINYDLYKKQVTELARLVKKRVENETQKFKKQVSYDESKVKLLKENNQDVFICPSNSSQFASGMIINCPTIKDPNKYNLYNFIIDTFDCDYVFVLENERLYSDLYEQYNSPKGNMQNQVMVNQEKKRRVIELLPKSRGVDSHINLGN